MFHHFGWKLPIQAKFFRVLGVNRGQISIFHFITPKRKAHPCAIPRLLSHCASKSVQGSLLDVGQRKKNKKSQSYISPLCPEVPRERIFTKFGTNVPLVDIINPDKLCVNLFKGFDFTGGQISIFPSETDVAVITVLRYCAAYPIRLHKCKKNCSLSTTYKGEMTHRK